MVLRDQVKEWKKEDPDEIYQVPVESTVFKQLEIIKCEFILPDKHKYKSQDDHSHDNMNGMQSGHKEIESEKQSVSLAQVIQELGAGVDTVTDLATPFEILVDKKIRD